MRRIERGTVVAAWGGRVRTRAEIDKLELSSNYALPIWGDIYLAETSEAELDDADFVNHSCAPNCDIQNKLVMVTRRPIRAGEELTADFDHGAMLGQATVCRCGSSACRETVYF